MNTNSTYKLSTYKTFKPTKIFFAAVFVFLMVGVGSVRATNYYTNVSGDPNSTNSWWTGTNGTGSHPSNFTTGANVFIIQNGNTMTTTGAWTVSGASSGVQVNGTLVASFAVSAPTWTFNSGSTYQHAQNGGTIPTATWNAASNCNITGITSATTLAGLGQTFGNFTWNCPSQTTNIYIESNITIAGNFSVLGTGTANPTSQGLRLSGSATGYTIAVTGNVLIDTNATFKLNNGAGSCIMNVGGNLTLNSGNFTVMTGLASSTVNVTGNVIISGGTLNMNEDDATYTGTLNVKGNFTFSSGAINTTQSGWDGAINFNGNTTQIYSRSGGSISSTINFAVLSGSTLDVGTSMIDGSDGTFTLNSGAGIITAHAQGLSPTAAATGSIQVTGTKTYSTGANYTYNAAGAQATGNGLPTAAITGGVNIANGATVTSTNAIIVNTPASLTVNGTLTPGAATQVFSGTGTLTGTGTVQVNKTAATADFLSQYTELTKTLTGLTVEYTVLAGAQVVSSTTYNNLKLDNTSVTNTTGGNVTVNGTLTTTAGGTLNMGTYQLLGTLTTITNGGTIQTQCLTNPPIPTGKTWGGTVQYNATTGAQTVVSATAYNNLTLGNASGTSTAGGNLVVNGTLTTTASGTLDMTTAYTLSGTLSTITNNGTISTAVPTATSVVPIPTGKTWGGTIIYAAASAQTAMAGTYNNLTSSGVGTKTLAGAISVSGTLTLTNGIITTTGANLLSINNTATAAISGGSTTSFINGPVKWTLPTLATGTTYNFPVGKTSYLPFSLVNPITTGATTALVEAFNVGSGGSADNTTLTAISPDEYWSMTIPSNFTSSSVSIYRQATITPTYDAVGGSTAQGGVYTTLAGSTGTNGVINSNTFSGSPRYFVFGKGKPTITVSPSSLTGFTYPVGYGPSAAKSFTVSGNYLSTNITVLSTDSFEVSLTGDPSFVAQPVITLPVSNGNVATTTIYVRMKAGFGVNASIAPVVNVTCSSTGATTKTITCTGSVTNAPVITVTPTSLSGFSYSYTTGPSTQQSFVASGTNLVSNITVTPPSSFEISTTSGSGFVSTPLSVTTGTTIYVRMMIALGVGSYAENIVLSATSTNSVNVSCSGTVSPSPTITASTAALAGFIYSGAGPSAEQSFTVTGSSLTASVVLTAPTNFQISTTSGSGFGSTVTLTQSGGIITPNPTTTIYVRLNAGAGPVTVAPINLTLTSTGGISQNVTLSGKAVTGATIITSTNTLSGFIYSIGAGPSAEQSFTVSAAVLTQNLTITPSSNFQISTGTGGSFSATNPITISGATINPTRIYVRLKSGLGLGDYSSETLTAASTGATSQVVTCSGTVSDAPTISASITGGGSVCPNTDVTLSSNGANLINYYWQGPNGFYSTLQNPSLGTLTNGSKDGTYTVTGNALTGPNLITNGDFEQGNTGFGSSYTYAAPATNALVNEGLYSVVANPVSVHNNFVNDADHTPSPGTMQMVVNGNPLAGKVVWSQSVPVVANTAYQFTYWIQTVAMPSPSLLQLYVNGVKSGPVYTASSTIGLWTQFAYNVSQGNITVANLELINQNTDANGNDFALDDISIRQVSAVTSSVSLTVNPTVAVSVSISASINPLYSGGSVTFTATPLNGGSSPTYQWKVNTINAGTNSSTYTYLPATGDNITCVMTSNAPCPTGNPATSNQLTAIARSNFWIGSTSVYWSVASNWSAGFEPVAGDDVEYANGTNYNPAAQRDLWLDADKTIGSLINPNTGKKLIIPAGKSLIVNNNITTNNSDSIIYIYAGTSSTPNGSLIFHNPSNLPVYATVEMYSKAWFDVTAAINNRYHWQYFGIPIRSVTANPTFYASYVRSWNEAGDSITTNPWVQLNYSSLLYSFLGYEICQQAAKTFIFHGQLENGNFSSGRLSSTGGALYPGQHIFANSYTSAIDIRQLTFGSQTEATVYMYNTGTYNDWFPSGQSTPGNSPGQYTSVPINTAGFGGIPRQIPSMQGFLVKAKSNSSSATFGISYNYVVMNNTDPQRAPAISEVSSSDKVGTMIDVKGAYAGDRMWIFTESNCTRGFDNGWDGYKMLGSALTPQLFAMEADGNYQVNSVPDMNDTELAFQAGQDLEDTLTFTNMNLEKQYAGVYLVDLVENKTIDITVSGSTYAFVAESTPAPVKRFKIVTRPYEKNAPDADTQVKIFSSQGSIFVQNFSNVDGECMVYDIAGHNIMKVPFVANGVTAITNSLRPGAYVGTAITGNEKVSKRLIVR